jgi:hypothetical protein
MSLVKIGEIYMINKEETMEKIKQLWATVVAHKKISIAVAVVIVLLILY